MSRNIVIYLHYSNVRAMHYAYGSTEVRLYCTSHLANVAYCRHNYAPPILSWCGWVRLSIHQMECRWSIADWSGFRQYETAYVFWTWRDAVRHLVTRAVSTCPPACMAAARTGSWRSSRRRRESNFMKLQLYVYV